MQSIKIYPESWAALNIKNAGASYRPGNGEEGAVFVSAWCENCARDEAGDCLILCDTYCYDLDDESYPKEWQYGADGQPVCTAFELLEQ